MSAQPVKLRVPPHRGRQFRQRLNPPSPSPRAAPPKKFPPISPLHLPSQLEPWQSRLPPPLPKPPSRFSAKQNEFPWLEPTPMPSSATRVAVARAYSILDLAALHSSLSSRKNSRRASWLFSMCPSFRRYVSICGPSGLAGRQKAPSALAAISFPDLSSHPPIATTLLARVCALAART